MQYNFNQQFFNLFKGRTDKVGLATTKSTDVADENEILNHVTNHLNGTCRLGFYNYLSDGTTPWAVVEFEDHGKEGDPKSRRTIQVIHRTPGHCRYTRLQRAKQTPEGKSYHLWIFFNQPIKAEKVHKTFKKFVSDVMGIEKTEVFPKGYDKAGIGNFVWLPLFGGTDIFGLGINEGRTVFIDAAADQMEYLKTIQRVDESDLDRLIEKYQLKTH
jgi:hypothetical protein